MHGKGIGALLIFSVTADAVELLDYTKRGWVIRHLVLREVYVVQHTVCKNFWSCIGLLHPINQKSPISGGILMRYKLAFFSFSFQFSLTCQSCGRNFTIIVDYFIYHVIRFLYCKICSSYLSLIHI